ncbi:uncharacterized protein N7529_002399 [Penicillium soppii]|jgi:hypothetical protein|uniref:uncharacterized protein n=1 Tax=Penicillium soppii TaxID=69789 RepID=UPI002546E818|nr:uncharacterized protein N7529_002399 [Penicillium soppii]KAJ5873969.1 hypothetical protein N7529_002399 [Penicillium soppii]
MDDESYLAYPSIGPFAPFAPSFMWEKGKSYCSAGGYSYGADEILYMNCQQSQSLGRLAGDYGEFIFGIDPRLVRSSSASLLPSTTN